MGANQQPSLDDAIEKMRSEIILASSKAEQSSLNAFDLLINQLRQYNKVAIDLKKEIERLQTLCEKNNIDYKPKPIQIKPDMKPVEKSLEIKPKK